MYSLKTPLLTAILSAGLIAGTAAQAEEQLLIGSTSTSSSQYGYFVAVGQIINQHVDGVRTSVVETGATVDNLRRILRNQVDMGLVTTNVGYHAYAGEGEFESRPVDNRLLWVYSQAPQNVVMREDSGVTSMAELDGARLNPGITGSATEATTIAVMETLGLTPEYVRGSTTDVVAGVKDNRMAGYVKSGVGEKLDGSSMDIATFTPIQVLSLSDEQAETLNEQMPDISVVNIPEGAADGMPAYTTWSFGLAMHASPELDEETAYQIVKAVMENPEPQVSALANLADVDIAELTLSSGTVPFHPGAARYFEEQGYDIPDRLMPSE
ncbi:MULTISPECIES: TAXI family TRAP transporter solute-binding subunit [Halomonadaceae]|jgi:TRAP transporter TAXI family solute receptor|uniref:C4-dicarboxylate ABC transporter substrate-binding protein n=2 Tax=Vreelandella TaxID=3137766 RepID=A0A6F8SYC9_9GAMM|nr:MULTISPECIES: TAXI family TRAP transporter solute-binding subunit [Halomonas]KTG25306.1 TRAP ABC transporter substrate-binding protein [Idiomarina sp. H105]MEC8901168.1 TAXI family TRAP transporter solute-binding subunit [Pseudomonadota bacterium]OAE95242.1 TRAP ABC transporter substrate-binding protein [Idiomarina sp. WRN-38]HAY17540.1 TRAP transporter substrate-binding protein [Halomonas sp.]MCC4287834.1 TAXI family TRAP transporter solute-binding subunit [Halomonas meridiana]|tara:strand:- start:640 stop:1614 length:975 start_codon:yes stop_codon:yes gene_type:complete